MLVAGTRPNFMKVAPLMRALSEDGDFSAELIHTGQHYDDNMSGRFFRDLGLPQPHYELEVGSGSHAQQTAEIMRRLEPVFIEQKPAAVVVVGDVNSTLAAAVVAKKLQITVVHAEAGLRSFDRSMPEEINRLVTDSITDVFLVTEESGRVNLLREGVPPERIHLVGNLMIDSLQRHLPEAQRSGIREKLGIAGEFGLVTLHRPANVDDLSHLREILSALDTISRDIPLYWPMHPRTRKRIEDAALVVPDRIRIVEPLGYLDFLGLEAASRVVLTDSGGVQEETTVLGVPCLTLRDNTERPVTLQSGTNRLAGTRKESILRAWRELRESHCRHEVPPLWDGQAGQRCRAVLRNYFAAPA